MPLFLWDKIETAINLESCLGEKPKCFLGSVARPRDLRASMAASAQIQPFQCDNLEANDDEIRKPLSAVFEGRGSFLEFGRQPR